MIQQLMSKTSLSKLLLWFLSNQVFQFLKLWHLFFEQSKSTSLGLPTSQISSTFLLVKFKC